MAEEPTKQTAFRLPLSLVKALDQEAKERSREYKVRVTRTDVVNDVLGDWAAKQKRKLWPRLWVSLSVGTGRMV